MYSKRGHSNNSSFLFHPIINHPAPSAKLSINPSNLASQALIPSTINQAASTTHLTPSVQSSTTQHPQPSFIPSSLNHPTLPISTATVISFGINPSNLASQALIPSTINQAASTTHLTPSVQSSTTQHPQPSFIPSSFNHPALPISTAAAISFGINPSNLASQALIPSTINQAASTTHLAPSIQSSTTQHPQPSFIPSSFNHPALPISTAAAISFGINPSNLASQALIPSTINQAASTTHLTPSIQSSTTQHPQPSFIPSSFNHPALPISTATVISFGINPSNLASQALIPSTINQAAPTAHATPVSCTDPATMAVFREYGSGLLNEWLDSLTIPRNVENLQQVKEIWEVGNVYCPPLHKWTVTMRNHRSKTGKNSSIFSQRKYIYNLFKNCNFDENLVFTRYNEQRPGKLYKMLNTKSK